jgi:hypothetical protein
MKSILLKSKYKDKTDCIWQVFFQYGIADYITLQSAPVLVGSKLCGIDIYQLVEELNYLIELEKIAPVVEEKPARVSKKEEIKNE